MDVRGGQVTWRPARVPFSETLKEIEAKDFSPGLLLPDLDRIAHVVGGPDAATLVGELRILHDHRMRGDSYEDIIASASPAAIEHLEWSDGMLVHHPGAACMKRKRILGLARVDGTIPLPLFPPRGFRTDEILTVCGAVSDTAAWLMVPAWRRDPEGEFDPFPVNDELDLESALAWSGLTYGGLSRARCKDSILAACCRVTRNRISYETRGFLRWLRSRRGVT